MSEPHYFALQRLRHAAATLRHLDHGDCPLPENPADRDPGCPVCVALGPADHEPKEQT